MISFDVVSLFTNVPLEETISHICSLIPNSELPFSKQTLKKLLNLACKDIIFSFNGQLYQQFEGVCMGSNLGPTMAAFAMDIIEQQFQSCPIFYKRYVDDTFAIFHTKEEAHKFFNHLNTLHPYLKFTMEEETDNQLKFLDIQVLKEDNKIKTIWHVKETNTGTYLHKTSFSPMKYKLSAIRALIFRAYKICSNENYFNECFKVIRNIFITNGFHHKLVDKIKLRTINSIWTPTRPPSDIQKVYWKLPYVRQAEKLNKNTVTSLQQFLGPQLQTTIAYQTKKTASFFANKDPVSKDLLSNIVYSFTCERGCGHTYIGETVRHFSVRRKEHITGDKGQTEISSHEHRASDDNFKIVLQTVHTTIGEALVYNTIPAEKCLNKYKPPFNLNIFPEETIEEDRSV